MGGVGCDAWYVQFTPQKGESYCLESSVEIGRRELDAIIPLLRAGLVPSDRPEVIAAVTQTVKENGFWQMPYNVAAALVARTHLSVPRLPASGHEATRASGL